MAKATISIVIYRPEIKAIIANLQIDERYYLADTDLIFEGTPEDFTAANPDYKTLEEVLKQDLGTIPKNFNHETIHT